MPEKLRKNTVEVHSDWYNRTTKEINLHRDSLSEKESKKYKLDLLLRIAKRIDDFSPHCGECQTFQQEITRLVQELSLLVQMPSKESQKSYSRTINGMVKHLQKSHKLVSKGQNLGIWMAIGAGIGVAIGTALDNPGIGTPIGIGIGLAIGSYLDKKAKKEDKII